MQVLKSEIWGTDWSSELLLLTSCRNKDMSALCTASRSTFSPTLFIQHILISNWKQIDYSKNFAQKSTSNKKLCKNVYNLG